ncbi:MAG: hypothetical protein QW514_07600 [Thermoprotei archaeon]
MGAPRALKIIRLGLNEYYYDPRLHQLRNVNNPHDFINLDEPLGLLIFKQETNCGGRFKYAKREKTKRNGRIYNHSRTEASC